MSDRDYVSLIIAYRDLGLVRGVIERLARQTLLPKEVIVVDNGGTLSREDLDGLALSERVRLVSRPDNPGYGAAVNEARGSDAFAVLVLTHDAVFEDDLAAGLIDTMTTSPAIGATAPVLRLVSAPERYFSAGGTLSRGGRASHLLRPRSERPYEVDWVDGAIVLYRLSALDRIGWIAEEYFLYFEDVDTAWRMREAGLQTVVVPAVRAGQEPGVHPMRLGIRNMTLFARKARIPFLPHVGAVLTRIAEESAAAVLQKRRPPLWAALRGWYEGRRGVTGRP